MSKTTTDLGTAAAAAIGCAERSLGVKMDDLKKLGSLTFKVRAFMAKAEAKETSEMLEVVDKAFRALKAHAEAWEADLKATPMEERMLALEKVVKKSLEEPVRRPAPPMVLRSGGRPTYVSVVAPPATTAAVRIRVDGSKKMQPAELLNKAKQHIAGAYAVRKLRSNDTEVFVPSVSQRDTALSLPQPKEFQILKQDSPVEVLGFPLGITIEGEKNANNGNLIRKIIPETKTRISDINIGRIRWLHDGKENRWAETSKQTRGSVIFSLPTEALQREVVRNDIVHDSMLYTAQLGSPRASQAVLQLQSMGIHSGFL
ncbi:hypothetical protein K3495_g9386 [Podosphaera aphanis]|nr:hypothetical protein K3495_g9386 [Podosphaera aphanis]